LTGSLGHRARRHEPAQRSRALYWYPVVVSWGNYRFLARCSGRHPEQVYDLLGYSLGKRNPGISGSGGRGRDSSSTPGTAARATTASHSRSASAPVGGAATTGPRKPTGSSRRPARWRRRPELELLTERDWVAVVPGRRSMTAWQTASTARHSVIDPSRRPPWDLRRLRGRRSHAQPRRSPGPVTRPVPKRHRTRGGCGGYRGGRVRPPRLALPPLAAAGRSGGG
jgi:hypothetical protein